MAEVATASPVPALGKRLLEDLDNDSLPPSPKRARQDAEDSQQSNLDVPEEHPNESRISCPYEDCDRHFIRQAHLDDHVRSAHTGERPFKCDECDEAYFRKDHLRYHVKSKHTKERPFKCSYEGCSKDFITAQRLKDHEKIHQKDIRCTDYPPCDLTFNKRVQLRRHVDKVHLGLKRWQCTHVDPATGLKCPEGFDKTGQLQNHLAEAHGGLFYWCNLCSVAPTPMSQTPEDSALQTSLQPSGVGFGTFKEMQAHMKTVHPPQCAICGETAGTDGQLQKHVEEQHGDRKNLEERQIHGCPECGKKFTKLNNLTTHIRALHQKHKPFVCGATDLPPLDGLENWHGEFACGQAFTAKQSLINHIRRKHVDEKAAERAAKLAQQKRKKEEKRRRAQVKKDNKVSLIGRLTGTAYDEETGRDIVCTVDGCPFRFRKPEQLQLHLQSKHDLADVEYGQALASGTLEQQAMAGGQFWISHEMEYPHLIDDEHDEPFFIPSRDAATHFTPFALTEASHLQDGADDHQRLASPASDDPLRQTRSRQHSFFDPQLAP